MPLAAGVPGWAAVGLDLEHGHGAEEECMSGCGHVHRRLQRAVDVAAQLSWRCRRGETLLATVPRRLAIVLAGFLGHPLINGVPLLLRHRCRHELAASNLSSWPPFADLLGHPFLDHRRALAAAHFEPVLVSLV